MWIGRDRCVDCHFDIGRDYQATAHAQALQPVNLPNEPDDAEFFDRASRRHYRIYREGDELRHRESIRTRQGDDLVLADHPLQWAIGSGRFSRSYLTEQDGFLVESPATWYRNRPGWGLSPGYERHNSGFERTTELRCIACHAGRVEPLEGSTHRLRIHTQAIDCERCHGPGSLHEARHRMDIVLDTPDDTIVHPGRMDRERSEAICAQCHLHSAATVDVRGRALADFRPGLRLNDFSIPYGFESPTDEMQVVGHMEQMWLSRCYQFSETLTCTTCHDPHRQPPAEERVQYYRSACLKCHEPASCGIDVAERLRTHSDDNCITCHMPQSATDIPHFAFVHHRIGIHPEKNEESKPGPLPRQRLVPLTDVSHLSPLDQDRCLALAYIQVTENAEHRPHAESYLSEAQRLLEKVHEQGIRDSGVDAALSRLFWQRDAQRTIQHAEAVLSAADASLEDRATALFTLGTTRFEQRDFPAAIPLLEQVVRIRRYADAWNALSVCHEQLGDLDSALTAAEKAAEISPIRPDYQQRLGDLYQSTGQSGLALRHWKQARQLHEFLQGN